MNQPATLFNRDVKTISKHIANANREELAETSVVAKSATTASDGKTYQEETCSFVCDVLGTQQYSY